MPRRPREIKPILGCELYVCKKEDHRADPQGDTTTICWYWRRTKRAIATWSASPSEASLHGFYRKPRVSKRYLAEHSKGLIGFSGCLAGEACENLMAGKRAASDVLPDIKDIFGKGNFFLEIQDQGLELEKKYRCRHVSRMEKELGIPLVATNDSHYLCEDDHTRTRCCCACRLRDPFTIRSGSSLIPLVLREVPRKRCCGCSPTCA